MFIPRLVHGLVFDALFSAIKNEMRIHSNHNASKEVSAVMRTAMGACARPKHEYREMMKDTTDTTITGVTTHAGSISMIGGAAVRGRFSAIV